MAFDVDQNELEFSLAKSKVAGFSFLGADAPKIEERFSRAESLNGALSFSNLNESKGKVARAESCKQDELAIRKYQSLKY